MKHALAGLLVCLIAALSGCASKFGVAEIRTSGFSHPDEERSPDKYFEHLCSQPDENALYVEGRVVDDFCDALQWRLHKKDTVTAPESVRDVVLLVPNRDHENSGYIMRLYQTEIHFTGIRYRDGDWGRVGTFFSWTKDLVRAWNRLLEQASAERPE